VGSHPRTEGVGGIALAVRGWSPRSKRPNIGGNRVRPFPGQPKVTSREVPKGSKKTLLEILWKESEHMRPKKGKKKTRCKTPQAGTLRAPAAEHRRHWKTIRLLHSFI